LLKRKTSRTYFGASLLKYGVCRIPAGKAIEKKFEIIEEILRINNMITDCIG
jgi:hypothetical protein